MDLGKNVSLEFVPGFAIGIDFLAGIAVVHLGLVKLLWVYDEEEAEQHG